MSTTRQVTGSGRITEGAVATRNIADRAVTADKISNNSVTLEKLNEEVSVGLGTYLSTIKTHTPTGAAGDWAAARALIKEMAGVGEVRIGPGTLLVDSTENLSGYDDVAIVMHPGTVLHSTLAQVDGHSSSPIYYDGVSDQLNKLVANGGNGTGTTTLSSGVTVGALTLAVTSAASLAVGDDIMVVVGANIFMRRYKIVSIVGTTVTVDRPILYPFLTGAGVVTVTVARNLKIVGGTIEGTGDRPLQIAGAEDSSVEEMTINGSFAQGAALDASPYRCEFRRIRGQVIANANVGITIEMGEALVMRDVIFKGLGIGAGRSAVYVNSCDNVDLIDVHGSDSRAGITIGSNDPTETRGSHDVRIFGGSGTNCGYGAEVTDGSSDVRFFGTRFTDNTSAGCEVGPTGHATTTANLVKWNGCHFERNLYHLELQATRGNAAHGCRFANAKTLGHSVLMSGASPELNVTDSQFVETVAGVSGIVVNATGTADLKVARTTIDVTKASGNGWCIFAFTAVNCTLDDVEGTKTTGNQGALFQSSDSTACRVIVKGKCKATGASMTTGISIGSTGTVVMLGESTSLGTFGGSGTWSGDFNGAGAPSFSAAKGSTYRRSDGGAATCFYVNESGSTTWVGK